MSESACSGRITLTVIRLCGQVRSVGVFSLPGSIHLHDDEAGEDGESVKREKLQEDSSR